jgi:Methyltransferase domain
VAGIEHLSRIFRFPEQPEPGVEASGHGWFNPENREILGDHLVSGTASVIELGSWLGLSTRWIAERLSPGAKVIAVDHWLGSAEHWAQDSYRPMLASLYDTFVASCWQHRERIVPVRMSSADGLRAVRLYDVEVQVVYIDASHEYEDVRRDFSLSLDLFPEASVIGDDWDWTGVKQAVESVAHERRLRVHARGNCWWIDAPHRGVRSAGTGRDERPLTTLA